MPSRLVALALCALASCSSSEPAIDGTRARFELAALSNSATDFYALPFPNDLRTDGIGLSLNGFPNPKSSGLLDDYLLALHDAVPAFGAASALYVGFTSALDPATIPADPAATLPTDSAIQLIDLGDLGRLPGAVRDDDSTRGQRTALRTKWFGAATLFAGANTLALLPVAGLPLLPRHTYALVLTNKLHDGAGKPIVADATTRRLLGLWESRPETLRAEALAAPFVVWAREAGFPLDSVALASVFTVQDATGPMLAVRAAVHAQAAPTAQGLAFRQSTSKLHVFTGTFPVANFQAGDAPYLQAGGNLVFDAQGNAKIQRTEQVRFALTVPKGPSPALGFPILLYAHGTGGSYLSAQKEGLADSFADAGLATLTMDQVLHGPRNPGCDETDPQYDGCVGTAYFNFINPYAGRDNTRQGGADSFALTRLAHTLVVPQSLHPESLAVTLDASHIAFLGHSQGGLTGAPFVSAETELKAAAFSGTGGVLAITVLQRKDPVDFKNLAETLLGIRGKEELEPFHPVLALVQTFVEPADPINYARHFQKAPLAATQRDFLLFEGLLDPYTPSETSEALGAAAFLDLGGTPVHQGPAFLLRGLAVRTLPLSGNVTIGGATRTGALLQFANDGHFAIFDNPVARCRLVGFLKSSLAGAAHIDPCGG